MSGACSQCGVAVDRFARFCSQCGATLPTERSRQSKLPQAEGSSGYSPLSTFHLPASMNRAWKMRGRAKMGSEDPSTSGWGLSPLHLIALVLGGVMVISLSADFIKSKGVFQGALTRPEKVADLATRQEQNSPSTSNKQQRPSDVTRKGFDRFYQSARELDPQQALFSEITLSGDKVVLTTTPAWRLRSYRSRLQTVEKMWRAWARAHPSKEKKIARLELRDSSGGEVGGTSTLRGAWVEQE